MHYQDAKKLCQIAEVTKETQCLAMTSLVFHSTSMRQMLKLAIHLSANHGNIEAARWVVATIEFARYLEINADAIFEKAGIPTDAIKAFAAERDSMLAKAKEVLRNLEARETIARG